MTSSRSIISTSRWLAALAVLVPLLVLCPTANAGGRKRIVVLDFEGPKAEKFHDDLVRMIKKSHTVIASDKWNGAAEELDAATITEKNVKKVAKKLKIDGVIQGKIEKRRDEYILHLKLRSGASGELSGNPVDTKADGPKIDGKASRDIKEELLGAIDDLVANHGGGGDDDEDKPAAKKKKGSDDDDDDKPAAKKKKGGDDDDDDKPVKHGGFTKKDDDAKGGDKVGAKKKKGDDDDDDKPVAKKKKGGDDDDDDKPAKKVAKKDDPVAKKKKGSDDDDDTVTSSKHDDDETPLPKAKKKAKSDDDDDDDDASAKKKKRVAKGGDDDDTTVEAGAEVSGGAVTGDAMYSPKERAIDADVGMSFTARRLTWVYASGLTGPQIPPSYKESLPVAGAMFDVTVYPLMVGHARHDALAGLGFNIAYDRVLKISSQKAYIADDGSSQIADLATSESRLVVGAVYRYPVGDGAIGAKLAYQLQSFSIDQTLPNTMSTDIPDVKYSMIEPGAFFRYPLGSKLVFNADVGYLVIREFGDISTTAEYGPTTGSGIEGGIGLDYSFTSNIFARASFRAETIGMAFSPNPNGLTNNRDGDPTTQDVSGARDTYIGGSVTVGYLY